MKQNQQVRVFTQHGKTLEVPIDGVVAHEQYSPQGREMKKVVTIEGAHSCYYVDGNDQYTIRKG